MVKELLKYTNRRLRPSLISGPFPLNGLTNGHGTVGPHFSSSMSTLSLSNGHSDNSVAMEALEQEVQKLQLELKQSQDLVKQLKEREMQLIERLAENAQRQFSNNNSHFEDLNLGENRPTELIRYYGNLYSEGRMEALDSLDNMPMMGELSVLKEKILFSAIVLSFRATQQAVHELRGKLRHLLNIPHPDPRLSSTQDPLEQQMEKHIEHYLSRRARRFDVSHIVQEVCSQIYATLFDYPCLKDCVGLQNYIATCVRTAWGLSVQNPPYFIAYDSRTFNSSIHTRFHTSDASSDEIKSFLWPALTEGFSGECVHKGVVVT
ncbi:hypothetical protein KUTeg_005390 [Tegillarca granosa]|uniref:Mitochondria-eating protein n=1 Tax=Tegillarca granosa TaxID=220873 RepID=A0ABQ9FMT9_TEGGR|nr:hypothetical protein KUTeg_005390 [Tegillarca granosa]